MSKLKYYIAGFRLRTLPLSVSGIIVGSALAYAGGCFSAVTFLLGIVTTLCLQILSNLSNELGDMQKGTDNADRLGPHGALQSGALTEKDYYRIIGIFIVLSAVSGLLLILSARRFFSPIEILIWIFAGGLTIIAAIKYTMGENSYGYKGWGDTSVFIFFGLAGVLGMYLLMCGMLKPALLLPASAFGLLITGVLNVNNIRDIDNDRKFGKNTVVVKIGLKSAKIYHFVLIITAWICLIIYSVFCTKNGFIGLIYIVLTIPFAVHLTKVYRGAGRELDAQIKFLSLNILLLAVVFSICQIF